MADKPYNTVNDLADLLDLYIDDPVAFVEDIIGAIPDDWQQDVLTALATNKMVTVRSGQGVGKTALESWSVLWYLSTRPFPKIVCTAPTKQQLYEVLWAEINKWLSESALLSKILKWTKTKLYMIGYEGRWWATAKTATRPENMQGFHEDYMLFIADEASGIEDKIMEAIFGTLSGDENKLLMCGNPTRTSGFFYDSHNKDREIFSVHKVSSMDSTRTSKENIAMLKRKYNEESDVYRVRVLGEFPRSEPDTFIPLEMAEAAVHNELYEYDEYTQRYIFPYTSEIEIGVDVARFGDDETTIYVRLGQKVVEYKTYVKKDTTVTAGWIIRMAKDAMKTYERNHCIVKIDDDGVGGGVTDRVREVVREEQLHIQVIDCHNGSKAHDSDHYENWGSEAWAVIRDLLVNKQIQIPNDEKLIAQLTTRKYTITSKGRIRLESKKEMKDRGLPSPDRADGLVNAFAQAVQKVDPNMAALLRGMKVHG